MTHVRPVPLSDAVRVCGLLPRVYVPWGGGVCGRPRPRGSREVGYLRCSPSLHLPAGCLVQTRNRNESPPRNRRGGAQVPPTAPLCATGGRRWVQRTETHFSSIGGFSFAPRPPARGMGVAASLPKFHGGGWPLDDCRVFGEKNSWELVRTRATSSPPTTRPTGGVRGSPFGTHTHRGCTPREDARGPTTRLSAAGGRQNWVSSLQHARTGVGAVKGLPGSILAAAGFTWALRLP